MRPDDRPLIAGGQGRSTREMVFAARVVLACAVWVLAIAIAQALGVL